MKVSIKKISWLFASITLISALPLMAQTSIVGSQHDLSGINVSTDEVCVFCHTPHGADTSEAALPLWNKALPDGTGYTRYSTTGTPSFDSTEADVGSISLACLSCHDGSQAMDSVINAPGSDGYNALGTVIGGTLGVFMTGSPVPMLTTDLSDDHPISIPYGAGGAASTDADGPWSTFSDPDFKTIQKDTLNGQPIWWVDTADGGGAGTREKKDLPLYTRNEGTIQPFVECGSCHDPHNAGSQQTNPALPLSVAFLRTDDNGASKICVACHDK